ncbi:hypothetical protein DICPUDRAFT_42455 [Dictyostelium purpureum]|uniref:Stress-response A/B barrel domain-containing protein n=1 Tax=Dictyostelium purpureum TaxID=5786 RepID=F1A236_DICPU|nr:uncharacterized protein DICPUDRAFT_42455 [Dictyostelium purpureum]EGC29740.1 hypothetical protein DICPUDRAFT_42455 [Dictyostelium purpureum]|eukprot:XP_003293733.1 hypothetical protein DICPUDRAFT_42455 [Dictyostelium purpureum]
MARQSLEHILFMQLKEDMTEAEFKKLTDCIEELKGLPGVLNISFGKNFSDRSGGYNYGYRVLFDSKEALDIYGPHPIHERFKSLLNEVRTGAPLVADFFVPEFPYPKY